MEFNIKVKKYARTNQIDASWSHHFVVNDRAETHNLSGGIIASHTDTVTSFKWYC